jgi:hypothetical protein
VKRLSGHGLRRIADTSRASLSAYRIDKPSIFRTWVLMSEWGEMVIMSSSTSDHWFYLRRKRAMRFTDLSADSTADMKRLHSA